MQLQHQQGPTGQGARAPTAGRDKADNVVMPKAWQLIQCSLSSELGCSPQGEGLDGYQLALQLPSPHNCVTSFPYYLVGTGYWMRALASTRARLPPQHRHWECLEDPSLPPWAPGRSTGQAAEAAPHSSPCQSLALALALALVHLALCRPFAVAGLE